MDGTIPPKAFVPKVHTEVEKKKLLSSKNWVPVVEIGYCYLNAQHTFQTPVI